MYKTINILMASALSMVLLACGDAPATSTTTATTDTYATTTTATTTTTTTTATTPTTTPTQMGISASTVTVNSDGSDSSTITVLVLDADNAAVENATVDFSATAGVLSASSAVTDAAGKATVNFSAAIRKINQTATITATLVGVSPTVSSQIPIQITGSTILLANTNTNLTDNGVTLDTLTVTLKDGGGQPISGETITFTQSGGGAVTISPTTVTSDVGGSASVNIIGTSAGSVIVTVDAVGATVTQPYTVSVSGTAFGVTLPSVDLYAMTVGDTYTLTVNAPGVTNVVFATSSGTVQGVSPAASVITEAVAGGTASATFTATTVGQVTIQVYDANDPTVKDFATFVVSQPTTAASAVRFQTNTATVAVSTGSVKNTAVLTATVTDASNQPIGNAPVAFSIPGVSNGASISPVLVFTDAFGQASTTFTSGSLSSGNQGVDVVATVVSNPAINNSVNIVVSGVAGSIFIGRASKVVVPSTTTYQLPMSVIVTDSSGAAVPNALVALKVWPTHFSTGNWFNHNAFHGTNTLIYYEPCITATFTNEDINQNLILDPGEDVTHAPTGTTCDNTVANHNAIIGPVPTPFPVNGQLDPPAAAAGSLPISVVTDSNGLANFDLTYLKASAMWITSEITATTLVLGTETSSSISFVLPAELTEAIQGDLPDSSFGQ